MRIVTKSVVGAVGSVVVLVAALVVLSPQWVTAQDDPMVGTWVMNLAKSTPPPQIKGRTTTVTAAGQGFKVVSPTTRNDGTQDTVEYTINFDGKDHPATGNADWDTVSSKRVDPYTIEMVRKKAGKVVQTVTSVISKDGKTRTLTTNGVDAKGQKVNSVGVYDKK